MSCPSVVCGGLSVGCVAVNTCSLVSCSAGSIDVECCLDLSDLFCQMVSETKKEPLKYYYVISHSYKACIFLFYDYELQAPLT